MEALLALGLIGALSAALIALAKRSTAPTFQLPAPPSQLPPATPVPDPTTQAVSQTPYVSPVADQYPDVAINHEVNPSVTSAGVIPPSMQDWAKLLAPICLREGINLSYTLAWIGVESAGNPCSVGDPRAVGPDGNPREIGIVQLFNPDDLDKLGVTGKELRAYCFPGMHPVKYKGRSVLGFLQTMLRPMTSAEMQKQAQAAVGKLRLDMQSALKDLIGVNANVNDNTQWGPGGRSFLALVKLQHALPGISRSGMPAVTKQLGRPPRDWQEFRATLPRVKLDKKTEAYRNDFPKLLNNAEKTAARATINQA